MASNNKPEQLQQQQLHNVVISNAVGQGRFQESSQRNLATHWISQHRITFTRNEELTAYAACQHVCSCL